MNTIPVVKDSLLFFLFNLSRDSLAYLARLQKQYGDVYTKYFKHYQHYFISDPKWVEHILVTHADHYRKHPYLTNIFKDVVGDNNLFTTNTLSQWKEDHALISSMFDSSIYFETYVNTMVDVGNRYIQGWQQLCESGPAMLSMGDELNKLVIAIIKETIFHNIDLDINFVAEEAPTFLLLMKAKSMLPPFIWYLSFNKRKKYHEMIKLIRSTAKKSIASRLGSGKDYDDLLSLLLHASHVQSLDDAQIELIQNHFILMNVVGYVNTAGALFWGVVALANHPGSADKIAMEVSTVCQNRNLAYSDIINLPYTRAFVSEVLRLYPPAVFILRQAIEEDVIEDQRIAANSSLWINTFLLHRNPHYWENPLVFDPNRFLHVQKSHAGAYIPFGAGKRQCLARNFAFIELCVLIGMLAQKFTFNLVEKTEVKIKYTSNLTIRPDINHMILSNK